MIDGRLNRNERNSILMLVCTEAVLKTVMVDLEKRLGHIPSGVEKLKKATELVTEIDSGILATISKEQRSNLSKTGRDYELRLVPKMTPMKTNVVLDKETLKALVDASQAGECMMCVKTAKESRNCKLHRLLVVLTPMPHYEGELCPFNNVGWEN